MSTGDLKSIDKLRKLKGEVVDYRWGVDFDRAVDDLEAEIAERYMELPCDADGVPWHIGDVTENGNTVNAICFDSHGCHFHNTRNDIDPSMHTHSKPRTIEDVLRDVMHDYATTGMTRDEVAAKYAEEIRGMMA